MNKCTWFPVVQQIVSREECFSIPKGLTSSCVCKVCKFYTRQSLPFVSKASGSLNVAETFVVPRALLRVGATRPEKPGSRQALAARSHAQADSGGRGDPRGSFPWFSPSQPRPTQTAPPLRVPAPERGSAAAAGSSRRRHVLDVRPRPEQEAQDEARSWRQRRGAAWGPNSRPLQYTRRASARPKL